MYVQPKGPLVLAKLVRLGPANRRTLVTFKQLEWDLLFTYIEFATRYRCCDSFIHILIHFDSPSYKIENRVLKIFSFLSEKWIL